MAAEARGDSGVTPARQIGIASDVVDAMIAHSLDAYPKEACGLVAAMRGGGVIDRWYLTRNAADSARRYLVDPTDQIRADRAAEEDGREIVGVFHSHTHTDAFPSPTDVAEAPDPTWFYLVVSLRQEIPTLRSYRISEGEIGEDDLEVVGAPTA
ncbi:MAG: M67 family metallopeptidase [Acidimicrobiales bacterium]